MTWCRIFYLQAWKSFDHFEMGTNCRAWLFRFLFNTMHHYRRKWLNIRVVKESEKIFDQVPAAYPPLPEHSTDEEMMAALVEVPQDFRAAVLLIDVEEFSYKDAAGILNVPIGTVMSRLSRGRKPPDESHPDSDCTKLESRRPAISVSWNFDSRRCLPPAASSSR